MQFLKHLVLVAFVGVFSLQQSNAQNKIEQARKYIDGEQYQSALKLLNTEESAEAQYYKGDIYMHQLDLDKAKAAFEKGIEMDDDFPLNYVGIARLALRNNNTAKAATYIKKAEDELRRRVRDPRTFIEAMKAYAHAGLYDKAIAYGEKALNVTQENADLFVAVGNMYAKQNSTNLSKPVLYYNKALNVEPNNAEAYTRLAVAWSRAQRPKKALKLFNKAIDANPKYAPAYRELAIYYYRNADKKRNLQKAIEVYRDKYLPIVGRNCKAVTQYIQFVFLAGDAKTAINEINKLKQNKNCNELLEMGRMEGYAAYETGEYKQAEQALTAFIAKAPKEKLIPADYIYLGKAQLKDSTKVEEGIQSLKKSLKIADTTNKVSYRALYDELATTLFDNQMYEEAADMYKQKIEKFESYNGVSSDLRDMGRAYARAKQYKKADDAFKQLLEKDSTYVYGYYMRARVNAHEDMPEGKAMELYQKVIDMTIDQPKKYESYLAGAYRFMAIHYVKLEDEANQLKNLKKGINYFMKVYELNPSKYTQAKKYADQFKERREYIINRRAIIKKRKAAKKAKANQ